MRLAWTAMLVIAGAAIGCGSKSATCTTGAEACACFANDTCFPGLTCASHLCVDLGGSGGGGRGGGAGGGGSSGGQAGAAGSGGTAGAGGLIGAGGTSGNADTLGTAGTGGAAGAAGVAGTGGSAGRGGTTGGSAGGVAGGNGGAGGAGGTSMGLGCQASDLPPSMIIANFEAVDAGMPVIPIGGTAHYGVATATVANGKWHINVLTSGMNAQQYDGVVIYFNGNPAGTDCIDASQYTGIKFDLTGTISGTGCTAQYATNDSAHANNAFDPKGSGDSTSYPPQAALTVPTGNATIMMPFSGIGAPSGGNPATGIDKAKLTGVQWQFTTAAGTQNSCMVDVMLDNVSFY